MFQKTSAYFSVCFISLLIIVMSLPAQNLPYKPYPIRNGDFSQKARDYRNPAAWKKQVISGQYKLAGGTTLHLTAVTPVEVFYSQDVEFMPGHYNLTAEVLVDGKGSATIQIGDRTTVISAVKVLQWQKISIPFNTDKAMQISLTAKGKGKIGFRKICAHIINLDSSPVPLSDGSMLGGIVLPARPTPADEFAAYELQRCVFAMTGHVPGIKGRDKIFPGKMIVLGGTVGDKLKDLPQDSYYMGISGNDLILSGKTSRGTLYAAYDFLKLQGCGWYMPGKIGEVVPKRKSLELPAKSKIEKPDYDVRGFIAIHLAYQADSNKPQYLNTQNYMDWAVRNRMNAFWLGACTTYDFGAYRGHGHLQWLNHSYRFFITDEHPEWWVLHKGKRTKMHSSGRYNQLCLSNKELRQHAADYIIDCFKKNPLLEAFPLNPEDEPCYWCECKNCRKLDPDNGKTEWKTSAKNGCDGLPTSDFSMTDRVLNFANEVAEKVAKVYPDKLIEVYAYGSYRDAPTREKVHPNILIKYTLPPLVPAGKSLTDPEIESCAKIVRQLDGWKKAGVKNFALYDYGNFFYRDVTNTWFSVNAEALKTLHDKWGFRNCLAETNSRFPISFMIYAVRAGVLWNTNANYKDIIRDVCKKFYGSVANDMVYYYMYLDNVMAKSDAWKEKGYTLLNLWEFSMEDMRHAGASLEYARKKVTGDTVLEERVDIARLGHALLTISVSSLPGRIKDGEDAKYLLKSYDIGREIYTKYNLLLSKAAKMKLSNKYSPPVIEKTIYIFPSDWEFRKDPKNIGQKEKWYSVDWGKDVLPITIDKAWTAQGYDYHGVAWYKINFKIPKKIQESLTGDIAEAVYFTAIDGTAEIYLDGKKIGSQQKDVGLMWDKPFAIRLPKDFDSKKSHSLVVRVKKDKFAAGIWKPVSIVLLKPTSPLE